MKKLIVQILLLLVVISGIWYGLSRIDWMRILGIEKLTETTEEKLGKMLWEMYNNGEKEISNDSITATLDTFLIKLCDANSIDVKKIKIHLFQNEEVNAFAFPDNHLVINTGIIKASENESELMGVMAHEIAHIEHKHVMKKIIKELGLSAIISITTGAGGDLIRETIKLLSSTAYDRKLESEADMEAVNYLIKAKINPEHFANFLYRLPDSESAIPESMQWISTHPDSKERAEEIIKTSKNKGKKYPPLMTPRAWELWKGKVANEETDTF